MQNPVAVTGATGFVGGHVLSALIASGHRVRVLVRDVEKFKNIDRVEVVEGDLDDLAALEKLITGAGVVIHIAGVIAAFDRSGFFKVNQAGAGNVAKVAKAAGLEHFILVSSLAAREAQLSDYGASKKAGEEVVGQIFTEQRLTIVRPPAVYGPGDKATLPLIKAMTQSRAVLPGRADQKISLLFVEDLAELLVCLADGAKSSDGILEVDDGQPGGYGFADLVCLAGEAQGKKIALTLLPRPVVALAGWLALVASRLTGKALVLSPAKVRELYHVNWVANGAEIAGWQPKIRFKQGFGLALSWYRQNQWLPEGKPLVKSHKI